MTSPAFDERELHDLLGAMRDECITPEQVARLEKIISEDAEARRFYLRFMTIHGLLEQAAVALSADGTGVPEVLARPAGRTRRRLLWPIATAAAVLLAVSAWWLLSTRDDDKNQVGPVARARVWKVTPIGNARFERESPTELRLERGEVRIEAVKAGDAALGAAPKLAPMTVATPAGKVTVDGNDFLVGAHEAPDSEKKGDADMKRITRVLVLAGVATLMNPHGSITGEADSLLAAQADQAPVKDVVESSTGFAIDMYQQLARKSGPNLFFSPYSISLALTMVAEGARGETAVEMGKVLHFPKSARRIGNDAQLIPWQTALIHTGLAKINRDLAARSHKESERFELQIANAMWGEQSYPFRKQFVETLKGSYDIGAALPCDFVNNAERERKRINDWVADQTRKRIQNLLPSGSVGVQTRLVLTNAIYFKGDWQEKFDKRSTRVEDFFTLSGKRVKTTMMLGNFQKARFAFIGSGEQFDSLQAGKADNFRMVELPYKGGLSMLLIAPDNVRSLPKLEARLTPANLAKWTAQLRQEKKVKVHLPRFKFTTAYELPDALKQLGMVRAFRAPVKDGADLSGMSESERPELSIGGVYHKAFVAVNEEGTEAAAATGATGLTGAAPPPDPMFVGNRPFLFLIRDPATATVLFIGRVGDASGIANNDRGEAQERDIELARTTPTKHPLYQKLKNATGVAIIRTYRDPSGNVDLKGDDTGRGRTMLQCRVVLPLKGDLKAGALPWLAIEKKAAESELGTSFCDFFSSEFTKEAVLAIVERQGNQIVVRELIEADEAAQLIAANVFAMPAARLAEAVNGKRE